MLPAETKKIFPSFFSCITKSNHVLSFFDVSFTFRSSEVENVTTVDYLGEMSELVEGARLEIV